MERLNITGTSCSGKTTISRAVSERLAVPHVELDALFWGPGWTPVPEHVFRLAWRRRWPGTAGFSTVASHTPAT